MGRLHFHPVYALERNFQFLPVDLLRQTSIICIVTEVTLPVICLKTREKITTVRDKVHENNNGSRPRFMKVTRNISFEAY